MCDNYKSAGNRKTKIVENGEKEIVIAQSLKINASPEAYY